ncbi:permease prefix domain 1-containing protein [Dactylosporangium sp. NBC_01737]|uniref:permease prefix domain 1-containing protein n=1 Tax=Dactylosporangium sp. NBC_01737 TaxID=2975959 RepID=UPI002E130F0F|nr:permease prefix domain 1-containing protein [Dactylosporangium sp. NBC_01737]
MDGVSHGSGPIDVYVDGLAAALRGQRQHRQEMVTEARDSLLDAAEAYVEAGHDPLDAQRRAVADFGTHRQVVPGYQAELATLQGRRTATWIALVLPVMTLLEPLMWWDTSWSTDRASHVYWVLVDHFQYTSFLAAAAAGLAIVGFGWGSRFLRDGLQYARLVGQATVVFLGMHALLGATVFVLSLRQWPAAATWPPVLIGMVVNTAAFGYAGCLAVRCVSATRRPRSQPATA